MGHECCKEHEHKDEDELSINDLVYNNDALHNSLISLLIKKKVITEEEFTKALEEDAEEISEEKKDN